MNRLFLILALLFLLVLPLFSWAGEYPDPNRQTAWNNLTDGVHTLGQSPQQASLTKKRLHKARTKARKHSIYLAEKAKAQASGPITNNN